VFRRRAPCAASDSSSCTAGGSFCRETRSSRAEGSQAGFVEAGQDEFLLAGVGVMSRRRRCRPRRSELLGVDDDLLRSSARPQCAIGPASGDRPKKHPTARPAARGGDAVGRGDAGFRSCGRSCSSSRRPCDHELHLVPVDQFTHLRHRCRRGTEAVAPVQQDDAFRLAGERERPVERRIAAAADDQVPPVELRRILDAIKKPASRGTGRCLHLQQPWRKLPTPAAMNTVLVRKRMPCEVCR